MSTDTSAREVTTLDAADIQLLRRSMHEAVGHLASPTRTRQVMDGGDIAHVWRELNTALELTAIPVPEELGGTGAGWAVAGIALEELGGTLYPAPYLTICLATRLLLRAATPAAHRLLPAIAAGDCTPALVLDGHAWSIFSPVAQQQMRAAELDGTWQVTGRADGVLGAAHADVLLVLASSPDGPLVLAVSAADAHVSSHPTLDPSRPVDTVQLTAAPGTPVATESVEALLDDVRALGAAAQAVEAVGGAGRCLDLAVDHVSTRSQFGAPIGSFQAVKHACADLLRELEPARSAAYAAMQAADGEPGQLQVAAALAKVVTDRVYPQVALEAVQLHGAMGFTWEMDLHVHVKRAVCNRAMFGGTRTHRDILTQQVHALTHDTAVPGGVA